MPEESRDPVRIPVKTVAAKVAEPEESKRKPWHETVPGLLTAIGGVIAAVATLLAALNSAGLVGKPDPTATLTPTGTMTPTLTATAIPSLTHTATALPTSTPVPPAASATAMPTPVPEAGLPWRDDFQDLNSGWGHEAAGESYEMRYVDGEYSILITEPEYEAWSLTDAVGELDDFTIEVDARLASGPVDNDFGLLVRYQEATDDFYMFVVSSDGYFKALLHEAGGWRDLVAWTESSAIRLGNQANRLRIDCVWPRMRFYANGVLLVEVVDETLKGGAIGLVAGSGPEAGIDIRFDNLIVRAAAP